MAWNKEEHVERIKFEYMPEIKVFYQDREGKPGYKYKFWINESKGSFPTIEEAKKNALITVKALLQETIKYIEEIEEESV